MQIGSQNQEHNMFNFLRSSPRISYMKGLKEELALAEDLLDHYDEQITGHARAVGSPEHLAEPNEAYVRGEVKPLQVERWKGSYDSPEDYWNDLTMKYIQIANLAQQLRDLSEAKRYGEGWMTEPSFQLSESYKQFEDEVLSVGKNWTSPKEDQMAYMETYWSLMDALKDNFTEEVESGRLPSRKRLGWRYKGGEGYLTQMPEWAKTLEPTDRLYEAVRYQISRRGRGRSSAPFDEGAEEKGLSHIPDFKATPAVRDAKVKRPHGRAFTRYDEDAEVKGSLPDGVSIRQAGYSKNRIRKR